MKTPPFLLSATLLLWGWQSRLFYAALVMAAVLESARFTRARWDFSESDLRRIADLCTILLAIGVLVALLTDRSRFMILTLQWIPIPVFPLAARYVSGYAAGECSPLEKSIVVRQRHAHAWALAHVSGHWVEVDTTPPDWLALESAGVSGLVRVSDFLSFLRLRLALWRQRPQTQTLYLMVALVALGALFIKRLTGRKHMRRVTVPAAAAAPPADRPGLASEFYAIEQWLNRADRDRLLAGVRALLAQNPRPSVAGRAT